MEYKESPADRGVGDRDSPFVSLFSREGRAKILDVFLQRPYSDLTVSQVSDQADISRSTFHRNIEELIEIDVIKKTEAPTQGDVYSLNNNSEISKLLGKLRVELVKHSQSFINKELRYLPDPEIENLLDEAPPEDDSDNVNSAAYAPTNTEVTP